MIAGVVIGVLAAVGIAVGAWIHFKKSAQQANSVLLKNQSDNGFEDDSF
jgi:hypothetical protein